MKGLHSGDQDNCESQACLTISLGIKYNVTRKARMKTPGATVARHNLERQPPFPIYIGLNFHALTRSRNLFHQLHGMGFNISYCRVRQIEEWVATSAKEFVRSCLSKVLLTVGALDNLDYNLSSTTSVASFHGTGIRLF